MATRSLASTPVPGAPSWAVESNPPNVGAEHRSPVRVTAMGGRGSVLTPTGIAAVIAGVANYYTAVNLTGLQRLLSGAGEFRVMQDLIVVDVLAADVPTVTAALLAVLGTPGNVR